jgi:hypothetical protein
LALSVLGLSLGGCMITSESPLFTPVQAAGHPLAQGRWAFYGAGCDVTPLHALPECAAPMDIRGAEIIVYGSPGQPSAPSGFLLVEGDPEIIQQRDLSPPTDLGGPPTPTAAPRPFGYTAFRPLHQNAAGQTDRGIVWPILCDDNVCNVTKPATVREKAKHQTPFSFFMTWIGPAPPPAS